MKISHFHPDERMAIKFVLPLIIAERDFGYETELFCSERRVNSKSISIPYSLSVSNLYKLPFTFWYIFNYLAKRRPNVVFCHNTRSALIPLLCAALTSVRVRVYFNHGVPYVGYRGLMRWLLRTIERLNYAFATHVITVSNGMVQLLSDVSPNIKAQVICNGSACGIDIDEFSSARSSRADWRRSHGFKTTDLVVAYIGRPEKRKGFDLILRLWVENIKDEHIKLVLCGPKEVDVKKLLGFIPSNIMSLGYVDNIPDVLSGSDMMVLPSFHEGLPYACIEAQAAGVLVVANNIDSIGYVVEDGLTGFLVPDNDINRYEDIIRMVDKDRKLTSSITKQAQANVAQFSRKLFIPSYLSYLSNLQRTKFI